MKDMEMEEKDTEYQAECDAKCLLEAEAIKADPTRLAAALKTTDKQAKAIESLADLRKTIKRKQSELQDSSKTDPEEES